MISRSSQPARFTAALLLFDAVAFATPLLLGVPPIAYARDLNPVVPVSVGQLLAVAWLAWGVYRLRRCVPPRKRRSPAVLWALIAGGFLYLALDEALRFHENLDVRIHRLLQLQPTPWTNRLDDLIVASYAIVGGASLLAGRGELAPFRAAWPYLAAGFALTFGMVALDILTHDETLLGAWFDDPRRRVLWHQWLSAVEELFKLLAEAFFVGALFVCRQIAAGPARTPDGNRCA